MASFTRLRAAKGSTTASTGGLSDKVISMMGLDTTGVIEGCTAAKEQNEGAIAPTEFGIFWARVEERSKEMTTMIAMLLDKLCSLPAEEEKKEKDKDTVDPKLKRAPHSAFANTLLFVALFLPLSGAKQFEQKKITAALDKYAEQEKGLAAMLPQIKEVMRIFKTSFQGEDLLGASLIGASTLHTKSGFESLNNHVANRTLDVSREIPSHNLFWHVWVREHASCGDQQRLDAITGLLSKFLTLPFQMKKNANIAITTAHALFFMMRTLLSLGSLADVALLDKAACILQQFYYWPLPLGQIAADLLRVLDAEKRWPGHCMTKAAQEESFRALYPPANTHGLQGRALYWVVEEDSTEAHVAMQVLRGVVPPANEISKRRSSNLRTTGESSKTEDRLSTTAKGLLLLNALHYNGGVSAEEQTLISQKPSDVVETHYTQLRACVAECLALADVGKALELRTSKMKVLKDSLLRASGTGAAVAYPPLRAPYTCPLSPVEHVQLDTQVGKYTLTDKGTAKLMCLDYMPYPTAPVYECLEYILHQHALSPKPCDVSVMVGGGDALVHAFVCAYLAVRQTQPDWLTGINLKFCIVPFGENTLAQFIAHRDSWYHRHVFSAFTHARKNLLLPWLYTGDIKADADAGVCLPGRFFRETAESYARDARETCAMNVFKVEGYFEVDDDTNMSKTTDKLSTQPDTCIPFVNRVEIGVLAQARGFKEKKGLTESVAQIASGAAGFAQAPLDLQITFTATHMKGTTGLTHTDDPEKYKSLIIANMPQSSDKGAPANPLEEELELSAVLAQPRTFYRNNILASEGGLHVKNVNIAGTGHQCFHIVADGQLFGPFHHLHISPITTTAADGSEAPVSFPVQTFFPVVM